MDRTLMFCSVLVVGTFTLEGCFPYRETYRPLISGRVVDASGAPVPAANVEACSDSSWSELRGCPRRATETTTADGKFEIPSVKEIDACCLGEAPLPRTIVSVCLPDGRIGGAYVEGVAPVWVTVPVGPPDALTPAKGGHGSEHRLGESKAEVTKRCADPANARAATPRPE